MYVFMWDMLNKMCKGYIIAIGELILGLTPKLTPNLFVKTHLDDNTQKTKVP